MTDENVEAIRGALRELSDTARSDRIRQVNIAWAALGALASALAERDRRIAELEAGPREVSSF